MLKMLMAKYLLSLSNVVEDDQLIPPIHLQIQRKSTITMFCFGRLSTARICSKAAGHYRKATSGAP